MKRLVIVAVFLLGCLTDPMSSSTTTNQAIRVELLFEHEGCKVYRFSDAARPHYYAVCGATGAALNERVEACGKKCTTVVQFDVPAIGAKP